MTTLAYAARDSATMLRRNLRHSLRYPMMTVSGVILPIFFLLLFVGVFGHALRAGLGAALAPGAHYIDYLTPGIVLMTAAASAEATALSICTDMNEGIVDRFRTMAISRTSVLTGQVLGSVLQALVSVALVVAAALVFGFRPSATPTEWVAAAGIFTLLTFSLTWLAVAFGLVATTPAGANSLALILVVLPFVSSAFVPTDSMPTGARWFAQNQPFTSVIQTLRGLLMGGPIGHEALVALAWCAAITGAGYLWARRLYNRTPNR